ncbi:MAG: thioredoxin family protein [Acidobacteriota bacterium]
MLEVVVVGPGCSRCMELEAMVRKAVEELGLEAEIRELSDQSAIRAAGVEKFPGLLLNGRLLVQGWMPTEPLIKGWLSAAREPSPSHRS